MVCIPNIRYILCRISSVFSVENTVSIEVSVALLFECFAGFVDTAWSYNKNNSEKKGKCAK